VRFMVRKDIPSSGVRAEGLSGTGSLEQNQVLFRVAQLSGSTGVSHRGHSSIRSLIVGMALAMLIRPALADDHLVPGAQIVSGYETSVSSVLKRAFTDDLDALSIVEPSFEPEFAVGARTEGGRYRVFYLVAKEQVWAKLIQKKSLRNIETNYSEYEISPTLGRRIARVWDAMLRDIGPDPHPPSVLDGSNYFFSKNVDVALRIGMSWDQLGGTKTGRLQEIDYLMRDLCLHPDAQLVDQLSSKVAELLKLLPQSGSAADAADEHEPHQ